MSNYPIPIPNGNYQIFPYFVGTDEGCASPAVYLLPPSFTYSNEIVFSIDFLYVGTGDISGKYANDDFSFSFSQSGGPPPAQDNVSVNITLFANNMWKCADSARDALMSNFTDFLENVETQFEVPGLLVTGGTFRIGQQIADRIPAPLIETLFYRYGLCSGFSPETNPNIDVRAGMRLLLETQISQFLSPTSAMNGYISDGRFPMTVDSIPSANGRIIAFNAFLGNIKSPSIMDELTTPVVAGSVIDLQIVSGQRKYWRLFYPQAIGSTLQPGDQTVKNNVTLIGAQTLKQLNAATSAYPTTDTTGNPPNVYTVFLGRAFAIPEIPVWITVRGQTSLEYVSIGTTVANIVQRYMMLPLNPAASSLVTVVRTSTANTAGSASINIFTFGLKALPSKVFDTPLIAGDGITFG